MAQEKNDLGQLYQVVKILANVYKTQATDGISDDGNLSTINAALLNVKMAIEWLEKHKPKE